MSLQTVNDLSDAVVLESNLGLYLKPVSRIKINVQLPKLNLPGQSISSWHVMEKLKATVRPDTFLYLKSLKITSTVIKFEGELETKSSCDRALARLKAAGNLKLASFSEKLQVRAAHAAAAGPTRHDWEAFFRDAKGVNEMRPGERPDTIHLQELPIRWFVEGSKNHKPNEKLLRLAFGTFGKIRRMEIPVREESGSENTIGKTSSLQKDMLFEVYIQYEEYVEFAIAMDSLRGKKLLYKEPNGKVFSADIKVDFDRTRYLSEACIKKREAEEQKLHPSSTAKKEKETKNSLLSTSQAKPNLEAPVKSTLAPEQTSLTSQASTSKDSKTKKFDQVTEEKKKSQTEAKFLLRELLLKAEKTERCKEQARKGEVNRKKLESQKRHKESVSDEANPKKMKSVKNDKELESCKMKHSKDKVEQVKEYKGEKRTHSAETKTSSKKEEKRIKTDVENKYKMKNDSKRRSLTHLDKTDKDVTSRHTEKKHKEREESAQVDKTHKDNKRKSNEESVQNKRTIAFCDKTTKDSNVASNHEKKQKEKERPEDCNQASDNNVISKHEKSKDLQVLSVNEAKDELRNSEDIWCEKETEDDEQIRMYMEEKRLKERLIQSYKQNERNKEKLLEQERILKEKLLRKLRAREKEKLKEREKLRKELSGRKVLKSVLGDTHSFARN